MTAPVTQGLTVQVFVPATESEAAIRFYAKLFGREPDVRPQDDLVEWATVPGAECWFQLVARENATPLVSRLRFRVGDIAAAAAWLDAEGAAHTEPVSVPGLVAFLDFTDPWDNRLGYYQDLA